MDVVDDAKCSYWDQALNNTKTQTQALPVEITLLVCVPTPGKVNGQLTMNTDIRPTIYL